MPDPRSPARPESEPRCVPLCGASKAYGRFVKPWQHERLCPVRVAWEAERKAAR